MLDTFNKDVNSRNEHLLKNTQLKLRIPCIELIVLYNGIPLFPLFFYMTVPLDVFLYFFFPIHDYSYCNVAITWFIVLCKKYMYKYVEQILANFNTCN